jgi:hypothetical protein
MYSLAQLFAKEKTWGGGRGGGGGEGGGSVIDFAIPCLGSSGTSEAVKQSVPEAG